MKHEKYKELLELNVLGELSEEEEIELKNHLFECEECSKEYSEIKKLYSLISKERNNELSEENLTNARKRLFNTINAEQSYSIEIKKDKPSWSFLFTNKFSLGFGTVALVLIGLMIGYLIFNQPNEHLLTSNSLDLDKIDRGEVKIANVNFPRKFSEAGEFEIKLADENFATYRGTIDDIVVQKLLANALTETENPGFKIKTAKSFIEHIPNNFVPDKKIKDAFISSLKTDKNPGVRKDALRALVNFQYDDEIRDAILYVLENDDNASNRMTAINALLAMNLTHPYMDAEVKDKLNERIINEENEVIKNRTSKLLIGGKKNEK